MKKLFLILAAAATTLAASSQTKELDNLNNRLTKSAAAVADAKKAASVNTWLERADGLFAASNAYTQALIAGLSIAPSLNMLGQAPA